MSGDGLLDTVELDQHGALLEAVFVNLRRLAARQKAPSAASERRTGELRVCVKFVRAFTARYVAIQKVLGMVFLFFAAGCD